MADQARQSVQRVVAAEGSGHTPDRKDAHLLHLWLEAAAVLAESCCRMKDPQHKALGARLDELVGVVRDVVAVRLPVPPGPSAPVR